MSMIVMKTAIELVKLFALIFHEKNQWQICITLPKVLQSTVKIFVVYLQWCAIEMQHLLHKPYVNEVTLTGVDRRYLLGFGRRPKPKD